MTIYQVCDTGYMGCCFCNHYFLNFRFIYFCTWRMVALQNCVGFFQISTWSSHRYTLFFAITESHGWNVWEIIYHWLLCIKFSLSYKLLKQTNKNRVCNKFPLWTSKYKANILYIQKEGEIETSEEEWRGKEKHEFLKSLLFVAALYKSQNFSKLNVIIFIFTDTY